MRENFSDDTAIKFLKGDDAVLRDEALSWLYKSHYGTVEKHILRNNGSDDDAADVFQDAIVVLYQNIRSDKFQLQSGIGSYLYAVARNLWLKKLRKGRFDFTKLEVEESYSFNDEEIIQNSQLTIREALEQIGNTCKNLLMDFYFHKKSMLVIAEAYELGSNEAARNKKYRCMQKLVSFVRNNNLKPTDFVIE